MRLIKAKTIKVIEVETDEGFYYFRDGLELISIKKKAGSTVVTPTFTPQTLRDEKQREKENRISNVENILESYREKKDNVSEVPKASGG